MDEQITVVGIRKDPIARVARQGTRTLPKEPKRISLDKVKFELVPEGLPELPDEKKAELTWPVASDIYRRAYRAVYHEWPTQATMLRDWKTVQKNAQTAGMDFKTFVTFILAGFKLTHPQTDFYLSYLTGAQSINDVVGLRKACLEKFNAADVESLGLSLDIVLDNLDEYLCACETSFGSWILGAKLRRGGSALEEFYDSKELGLHQTWLATEITYTDLILKPFREKAFGTSEQQKFRHHVNQDLALMKRRPTLATTVFNCRNRNMPRAVKKVLNHYGLTPDCFTTVDEPVYETYPFWNSLGLALQHYHVLKAVNGEKHSLWR